MKSSREPGKDGRKREGKRGGEDRGRERGREHGKERGSPGKRGREPRKVGGCMRSVGKREYGKEVG